MPPRRRSRTDGADAGSAAVEFVFAGLVLLVPIVYLIVALGTVQAQAMGAQTGARQLARALATAADAAAASDHAERMVAALAAEYGMDAEQLDVTVTCDPAGEGCPSAGATVRVGVLTRVTLPLVPPVLGLDHLLAVPIEAQAVQKVSRFAVTP